MLGAMEEQGFLWRRLEGFIRSNTLNIQHVASLLCIPHNLVLLAHYRLMIVRGD